MTQISINDWIQYFPFKEPRQQQIIAINFAIDAILNQNKKFVILSAGAGIGKSLIGVTISRFLQHVSKTDENFNAGSWFLTTQKILQEQYLRDFGDPSLPISMKSIKSSTSYVCQMHEQDEVPITCGEVHRLMRANDLFKKIYCSCMGKCKYRVDKRIFLESLESITNYSYFFTESQYAGHIKPRDLLVCDECHTSPVSLQSFVEISISEKFAYQQLDVKMPEDFKSIDDAYNWLKTTYLKALQKKLREVAKMLEDLSSVADKIDSFSQWARKHDVLDKHLCKINRLIKHYSKENWVFNVVPATNKSQRRLEFKPVDVSPFAYDHLFAFGKNVLLMSATILDVDVFTKLLGINKENVAYLNMESPFEPKNRPIHIVPVGSMSKNCIDETLPKLAIAVKFILDQHKNDKGIIHTTNFKIAKYLVESINDPRLIIHDATNRNLILKAHEECKKPSVLISPSMMEGVDLSDDKSRFQILCKVPFPYLGDQVVQKRMLKDKNWYNYQTTMSTVQAFGRSIRNEKDYAVTYVLDSDWHRFFKNSKFMFPPEIIKAIQ